MHSSDITQLENDSLIRIKYNGQTPVGQQVTSEINWLQHVVAEKKPEIVVEIGTAEGSSFVRWLQFSNLKKIISIDFTTQFTGVRGDLFDKCKEECNSRNIYFNFIDADSHEQSTCEWLKKELNHDEISFMFLDGGHTLKDITMDFEMYAPFVKDGGIIGFHDTLKSIWSEELYDIQVANFYNGLKNYFQHDEMICKNESFLLWTGSRPYGAGGVGYIVFNKESYQKYLNDKAKI